MDYKLARAELSLEPQIISMGEIDDLIKSERETIIYFDRENSEKNLLKLKKHFEDRGHNTYLRPIKFGLDENDMIYEFHIIQ